MRTTMDALADAVAPIGAGLLLLREGSVVAGEPTLMTAPIDAAVLIGCSALLRDHLASVRARGIPVVVIEGDGGEGVPRIALDNREAQRVAAEHVRDLGHRDVVAVTMPVRWGSEPGWLSADDERTTSVDVVADRLAGFRDVFPHAAAYAAADSSIDAGAAVGRALFAGPGRPPTAVVAQSDLLAVGVLRAAEEAGLRVPEDVSITGFDGVVVDGLAPFELTTLVQPAWEKGRAAGETVAALLGGETPASQSFTSTFRLGNTTGPIAAAS
jgi:DNA-binding LacI/PurR family transcriptional regulator